MGIDDVITTLQGNGCSPFFFTSALQSSTFGEIGRKNQGKLMESNMEFREHLQELKKEYSEEQLDAQIQFRRESYEFGRQYLIQQTILQNESRKKQIEFRDFLNNYWPLERQPYSVLTERNEYLKQKAVIPMNVLIAKTELTDKTGSNKYGNFCENLISDLRELPNIVVEQRPWKNKCLSRLGEAMNINYIMGGIPTLLIFPYQMGETIGVETASWSFGRGLQSMNHSKSLQIKSLSKLPDDIASVTLAATKATIGMTRDAYMLAEYHTPAVFNGMIDNNLLSVSEIGKQLKSHYNDMAKLADSADFKQLCTPSELDEIGESLNVKLLNA